jgi:hypothetical protein
MTLSPGEWMCHARGVDGQVHVVDGGGVVLGSAPHRTLCGRPVLVVCERQVETTCPECARSSWPTQVPVTYEPCG